MNATRRVLLSVFTLAGLATSASAAHYDRLDSLASEVESKSEEMVREVTYHFRHTRDFGHLVADSRRVAAVARHFHEAVDRGGDVDHLRGDLRELSRAVAHLDETVADAMHGHHGDHIHGDPSDVFSLLSCLASDLRRIDREIDALDRPACRSTFRPVPVYRGYGSGYYGGYYGGHGVPSGYGYGGRSISVGPHGVSVGNGRLAVSIGY